MTDARAARPCPVCGSTASRLVFRQDFAEIDHAAPITGYDVVVCETCGCGYADGIPDQATLDRYYREMSKYEYSQRDGGESAFDRGRLALIADIVAPRLPASTVRILDVGCATGRLLANLRDRGFANVVGLDPSPGCAAAAKRLYDVDVRTMTLAELAASGQQFDVVTMIGVLEHLQDLDATFGYLAAILVPGGLLYVEVPDATAFADWPNAPYQDFSTEHINFFGPVSLDNLMRRHGLVSVFAEQNHREQSYRTVMSNISGLFRLDRAMPAPPVFDRDTQSGLERYVASCADEDARVAARVNDLVDSGRAMLVWGVGTHTRRLMVTSRLAEAAIVAFVESNARYHGRTLHGTPIVAPLEIRGYSEPVLISSRVFQQEIVDQIRNSLGCSNELIVLYDV